MGITTVAPRLPERATIGTPKSDRVDHNLIYSIKSFKRSNNEAFGTTPS